MKFINLLCNLTLDTGLPCMVHRVTTKTIPNFPGFWIINHFHFACGGGNSQLCKSLAHALQKLRPASPSKYWKFFAMLSWFSSLFGYRKRKVNICVVGLDNSGKTTLLNHIKSRRKRRGASKSEPEVSEKSQSDNLVMCSCFDILLPFSNDSFILF